MSMAWVTADGRISATEAMPAVSVSRLKVAP